MTTQANTAAKPVKEAPKPEWVEVKDLIADHDIQQRAGWKVEGNSVVADYAEAVNNGAKFPAIVVFEDKDMSTRIADGFNRFYAHKQAGKTKIACVVLKGDKQDAIWYACGANKNHGLRRSNNDKKHAVLAALKSPKSKGLSDRAIADHCGVSHVFVGTVRTELEGKGEIAAEGATRTTAKGNTVTVDKSKKAAAGVASAATKKAAKAATKPKAADPVVTVTTSEDATDFDESNPEADDAKTGVSAKPEAVTKPASAPTAVTGKAGKAIDGDGDVVEGELAKVFVWVSKFGKVAAALNMIADEYEKLVNSPAGVFLGEHEATVLRSLADAVVAATPLRPDEGYENGWEPTAINAVDRNKDFKPE